MAQPLTQSRARATAKHIDGQLLYIISDENDVAYPIASLVPHEPCRISTEEFQGFEGTIMTRSSLEGMVSSMAQLIGQRVNTFSLDDGGKLVLPQNYANTRL